MSEWKKVKLGDCIKEINEKTTKNNQYKVLSVTKDGIFSQEEFFKKQIASKNNIGYKIIRKNNLVFSTMNLWMGSLDVLTNYDIGIVSPAYKIFEFNEKLMLPEYGNYFMKSYYMLEQYKNCSEQGASVVRRNLDLKALLKINIIIPPTEEQEKIMKILKNVEYLIAMNKQYIQNIIKFKEKIFDNFLNQDFEWKNIPFSEVFDIIPNHNFSRDKLNYKKGTYKNIHYGDILTKYNEIINVEGNDDIPFINNEEIKDKQYVILKDGDVIIADTAEDESVGRAVELRNIQYEKVLSGLHTIACRPKLKFVSGYLGFYINSKEYHKQLIPLMQGIKVLGITKNNIKTKTTIKFPNLEIQHKITLIMENYNEKIKLLERKMEEYENIKKGLMQKLLTGKVKVNV